MHDVLLSRNLKFFLIYVLAWFIGVFFAIWTIALSPFDFAHFFQSVVAGLVGGSLFYFTERSGFIHSRMRKLKILNIVLLRMCIYLIVIAFVSLLLLTIHSLTERGMTFSEFITNNVTLNFFTSSNFIITSSVMIVFTFILSFSTEIARMLGPGAFVKLLSGSYHSPVEEERIFMFLDLNNSTTIAEKLGHTKFSEFKNQFFYDISDPILDSHGEVFQYVGDEVILTWKQKTGLKNSRWLNFFFDVKKKINSRSQFYLSNFGVIPEFKAGCHSGIVFTSEVGDLKKSIVYNGDTVNTTARIESECRKYEKEILVSEELLNQTDININFISQNVDTIYLKGRSSTITLYTIIENNG